MTKSDAGYRAAMLYDRLVIEHVEESLQVLVAALIDINKLEIFYSEDPDFDPYSSCKSWEKKYCRCKPTKMMASYKSYMWFGNSKTELYCEIIKSFCGDIPLYRPFSSSCFGGN